MDKQEPSRPQRVKDKPLPPVSKPEALGEDENKYARRTQLIGKPTIGRAIRVETVGLGNLKVETFNGIEPDV
jgi:hypothetical protein